MFWVFDMDRIAIEAELEVLYDAYYEELEQYANHQQLSSSRVTPPPGPGPLLAPWHSIPTARSSLVATTPSTPTTPG